MAAEEGGPSTQAMSKIAYSWMTRFPNKSELKKLNVAMSFALNEHTVAAAPLRAMLRGHTLDPFMRILWTNLSTA